MKLTAKLQTQRFVPKRNELAFTLIEALLALSIFSLIVLFITPVFQIMITGMNAPDRLQEMEWDVFCTQVKREIRTSSSADSTLGRMYLTVGLDTVIYEKYGSSIRRRVNSSGNETILQNVSEHTFSIQDNGVKITVKDLRGNVYNVAAYAPINWKYQR